MENRRITSGEALLASRNIEEIERHLGYRVPAALVDYVTLVDHPLTTGEAAIIARNLESIGKRRSYKSNYTPLPPHINNLTPRDPAAKEALDVIVGALAIVGGIIYFIVSMFI